MSSLQAKSVCDLDIDNHENYRELTEVDMGFSANNLSKSLMKKSPKKFMIVTREYRLMLIMFTRKVLQKTDNLSSGLSFLLCHFSIRTALFSLPMIPNESSLQF